LENWYEAHPEARPIKVACFGSHPLEQTKVESVSYPPALPEDARINAKTDGAELGPLPGSYALSVNEIYNRAQEYRYFLNFEPVAMAGYSIYIYHVTVDDANRVRRNWGWPELP